jgi:DNA modification methylase
MNFKEGSYKNNNWKIYNEDCIITLSESISKNSVDCIITSPPYFHKRNYSKKGVNFGNKAKYTIKKFNKSDTNKSEIGNCLEIEKYYLELEEVFKGCFRVLKNDRFMFLNINKLRANKKTIDISGKVIESAEKAGFVHRDTIIWIKENPVPLVPNASQYYLWDGWEYLLLFAKGNPKLKIDKFVKNSKIIKCPHCGMISENINNGKPNYFYSYIGFYGNKKEHKQKNHPGVFSPILPKYAFSISTLEGDTLLDPFAGSGTTLIEGLKENRNVIGCELDEKIFNELSKRLENNYFI